MSKKQRSERKVAPQFTVVTSTSARQRRASLRLRISPMGMITPLPLLAARSYAINHLEALGEDFIWCAVGLQEISTTVGAWQVLPWLIKGKRSLT